MGVQPRAHGIEGHQVLRPVLNIRGDIEIAYLLPLLLLFLLLLFGAKSTQQTAMALRDPTFLQASVTRSRRVCLHFIILKLSLLDGSVCLAASPVHIRYLSPMVEGLVLLILPKRGINR